MMLNTRFGLIVAIALLANLASAESLRPPGTVPVLPGAPESVAPEWAISGHVTELSQAILADVPELGQVSSLDLLMFSPSVPALSAIPLEIWLAPDSIAAEPFQPAIRAQVERLAAVASLASRSKEFVPPADLERRLGFNGAMAGYAEDVVASTVKVEPVDVHRYYIAHPEKYLQRRRINARYIFMRVPQNATEAERSQVQQKLEAIAQDIRAGKIGFEDAARQYSNAPSATNGGRLPEFVNGTYFAEFERQLLDIQPNQLTAVFDGPGGFYLCQLISATQPQNLPLTEVTDEIRRTLAKDHVKHYYKTALGRLQNRYKIDNYVRGANNYAYMNLNAPLAHVGKTRLTRPQFLLYYDNPIQPGYGVNTPLVQRNVAHWIEGEIMMEEMEALGRVNDRFIARSRELGVLPIRARQTMIKEINPALYTGIEASTRTLQTGPMDGLRSILVARVQISPDLSRRESTEAMAIATERQITDINATIDRGTLPIDPEPVVFADWVKQVDVSSTVTTQAAIADVQARIDAAPYASIKIQVATTGWVDAVPNSQWDNLLRGLTPGQVSPTVKVTTPQAGTVITRYVLIAERPLNLAPWKTQKSYLEQMAWRALTERAILSETERVRPEIKFHF